MEPLLQPSADSGTYWRMAAAGELTVRREGELLGPCAAGGR